jgi:hypothetical protein
MTRDTKLVNKIFEITRGDLETAQFPFPQLGPVIDGMTFVRVSRLSSFWKQQEGGDRMLLEQSAEDLVVGLYGQSCPWMFLLKGSPKEVECWFGAAQGTLDRSSLRSILCSAFPDMRFKESLAPDKSDLTRLGHALVLTGTPSSKINPKHDTGGDQIEKVCRGLYGSHWCYAVYAEPIPAAETVMSLNEVSEQIQDAYATFLLKGSATDERNRMAQRYVELLETKLKRLEQGRTSGMWITHIMLLTDNASSVGRVKAMLHSAFSGEKSLPDPIRVLPCNGNTRQSPFLEPLTSPEVAILTRPPREEYPGYEVVDHARFGVESNNPIPYGSKAINIGAIFDRGNNTGNLLQVPLQDLTKHGLIVGVTGSGKTNTCFELLDQIWDGGKGVPFLVVESAKSEYRSLVRNPRFAGLKIFTVGDEATSPLRLNPFEVPKGMLVQTHLDYLKTLFSAAFVLYPPMPYVLEQSIQEVYEDRGWDLAANTNWRGQTSDRCYPTLADLASKVVGVVDRMGYDERITMDVKAGLLARINQLRLGGGKGLMFNTRQSLNSSVMFGSPCILELKQIVNDDEKAFIMGLILIRLYEYYEAESDFRKSGLHHITLIEEAHRLLRNVSIEQGSEITANPKGKAIEVFANILSEIRAYGEGILIAEQIPTKLTPDAIKNTNLKIIHRLVAEDDRKAVGSTMNLSESQTRYLTTLRAGEGIAYTEGMQKPVLLSIPLSQAKNNNERVTTQVVRDVMSVFWRQNQNLIKAFPGCSKCPSSGSNYNCATGEGKRISKQLAESFIRLFNTLRINKALVLDAYNDYYMLCQRNLSRHKQAGSEYCLFVELVDAEIERRGEFAAWSHEDVEKAIELAYSVVSSLVNNYGKSERKVMEKGYLKDLTALSNLFKRLHRVEVLPYPGCRFCADPCHYRFDMKAVNSDYVNDFRSGFNNTNVKMDEIARICWDISAQAFLAKDTRARRGAALCFAAQQLSELGLSKSEQEVNTRELTDCLSQMG